VRGLYGGIWLLGEYVYVFIVPSFSLLSEPALIGCFLTNGVATGSTSPQQLAHKEKTRAIQRLLHAGK